MTAPLRISWLRRIEKRYAWGVLGFIVGVAGVILAVLSLRERRPEMTFSILSESNVLDVHTPLPALDVLYEGASIQRANLNLRVIVVRIENTGDVDILQSFFDTSRPWGFRFSDSRIVDIRVLGGSSAYIRDAILPRALSRDTVSLEKVIFDRGGYAIIQALVLHNKTSTPKLLPFGKIAGIERFHTAKVTAKIAQPIWRSAFDGSPITQVLRFMGYGIAFIVAIILTIVSIAAIASARDDRATNRRKQVIDPILDEVSIPPESREVLRDSFIAFGPKALFDLRQLLHDHAQLSQRLEEIDSRIKVLRRRFGGVSNNAAEPLERRTLYPRLWGSDEALQKLADAGIIRRKQHELSVDDAFLKALDDLLVLVDK